MRASQLTIVVGKAALIAFAGYIALVLMARVGKSSIFFESNQLLEAGGDAQSAICVARGVQGEPNQSFPCIDIAIGMDYVLVDQPTVPKMREFRFLSRSTDGYVWEPWPLLSKKSPCGDIPEN
jgi:hypothetical protein